MDQQIVYALRLRLNQRADITAATQNYAGSRLGQVDYSQTNEERQGGDNFEIEEGLAAHPSHLFQVTAAGNTDHQRRENQRCDHRLDQVKEDVPEKVETVAEARNSR